MLQNTNTTTGNKIKQAIKGMPALAALSNLEPLSNDATYPEKKPIEKALLAAIEEYRAARGYGDNAGIECNMYFLLQGDKGNGDYSEELRKMKDTIIELMALLSNPEVSEKMEGYTRNYAGGMLKRLHSFFQWVEGDYFLSYMDKERMLGNADYEVDALNRTLRIYKGYDGDGPVYVYDMDGMSPKNEYSG